MNGLPYKDTFAAKGSALHAALDKPDNAAAAKVYKETTAAYASRYAKADREYFATWQHDNIPVDNAQAS